MHALAEALSVDEALLSGGADQDLLDRLRQAAADSEDARAEVAKVDDLAARYPGWARLIADQAGRIAAQEEYSQLLSDRISYDPALATALHGVISAVTSIRSTAAILTSDEALDADWQQRFHKNIHDDAMRLATDSSALVRYLDVPEDDAGLPLSPREEAMRWLAARDFHIAEIEAGKAPKAVDATALKPAAQAVLQDWLARYAEDASALPLEPFSAAATSAGYDPFVLSETLDQPLTRVLRRLAHLRSDDGYPPMGLAIVDAGGFITALKEVPGFAMPRGTACPLWPVFTVLGQPGRAITTDVSIPGRPETRAAVTAIAEQTVPTGGQRPPLVSATMLVIPDPPAPRATALPLGVACRICPRNACDARREPSALTPEEALGPL